MKFFGRRNTQRLAVFVVCMLALLSFIDRASQAVEDKRKVAKMTEKMKTVCVGRFLIDLPEEAVVSFDDVFVDGFNVSSTVEESDAEFDTRLSSFIEELATKKNELGRPTLLSTQSLEAAALRGKVFVYGQERTEITQGERRIPVESVAVRGMARLTHLSIDAGAERRPVGSEKRLRKLFGQFRPLLPDEIPPEPGFCIEHAIAKEPMQDSGSERIALLAGLPGHPDVRIVFSTMAGTAPSPGLLARNGMSSEREPFYMRAAFTTLREGPRTLNGLPGEELALRVREPNLTTGYSFWWEMGPRPGGEQLPLISLELDAGTNPAAGGKPVQSTLSEDALNDLWERIVSSIRPRPTETLDSVATSPAVASNALGTCAIAGDICPGTGWWQCADAGAGIGVRGGQRQFLKAGQRMPQALLLPQQTLWQRLRGVQPSYESHHPSLWKLVDKRDSTRLPPSPMLAHATSGPASGNIPAGAVPYGLSQAPIGSVSKTGSSCPASGWWRCEDSHALDGTRWFAAGSLLPPATFRAPVPMRGSLHPEHIHRRSAWLLVRLAQSGDGHIDSSNTKQDIS